MHLLCNNDRDGVPLHPVVTIRLIYSSSCFDLPKFEPFLFESTPWMACHHTRLMFLEMARLLRTRSRPVSQLVMRPPGVPRGSEMGIPFIFIFSFVVTAIMLSPFSYCNTNCNELCQVILINQFFSSDEFHYLVEGFLEH